MDKIKLFSPKENHLLVRGTNPNRRRALIGFCKTEELDANLSKVKDILSELGTSPDLYPKRYHSASEWRIELKSGEIVDSVKELCVNARNIGFLAENAYTEGATGRIEDPSHQMFIIYATIRNKGLTLFKKYLLENVFEVVKE